MGLYSKLGLCNIWFYSGFGLDKFSCTYLLVRENRLLQNLNKTKIWIFFCQIFLNISDNFGKYEVFRFKRNQMHFFYFSFVLLREWILDKAKVDLHITILLQDIHTCTWGKGWNPINRFNITPFLCLAQARTWIFNVIYVLMFESWEVIDCSFHWYWWICWPSLFRHSSHNLEKKKIIFLLNMNTGLRSASCQMKDML